jgi:hypothetical protein
VVLLIEETDSKESYNDRINSNSATPLLSISSPVSIFGILLFSIFAKTIHLPISTILWIFHELTKFSQQASNPLLLLILNKMKTVILYFHLHSIPLNLWKELYLNLFDSLWMKIDYSVGNIIHEMESESSFTVNKMDYLIEELNSYFHSIKYFLLLSLDEFVYFNVIPNLKNYFIPFLNCWIMFVVKSFTKFGDEKMLNTFRLNTLLTITELYFPVLIFIFKYEFSSVNHSSSSSSTSIGVPVSSEEGEDLISIKLPSWKWYLRFWLLWEILELKLLDLWTDRVVIQQLENILVLNSIPLLIGNGALSLSLSTNKAKHNPLLLFKTDHHNRMDIIDEIFTNDKDILTILSICSKHEMNFLSSKFKPISASVANYTQAHFHFYFYIISQLERKRIYYSLDITPLISYLIESTHFNSPVKR